MNNHGKTLFETYRQILNLRNLPTIAHGQFFDLMYASSQHSALFNPDGQYVFLHKSTEQILLIVVNFSPNQQAVHVNTPEHAFNCLQMSQGDYKIIDLIANREQTVAWQTDRPFVTQMMGCDGKIYEVKHREV